LNLLILITQDAITRVFYEMGIGSLSSVYDFYQSRVVDYHARLMQKCINMRDEYEQMRKPRTALSSTDQLSALKLALNSFVSFLPIST